MKPEIFASLLGTLVGAAATIIVALIQNKPKKSQDTHQLFVPDGYKVHRSRGSRIWFLFLPLMLLGGVIGYFSSTWFHSEPQSQVSPTLDTIYGPSSGDLVHDGEGGVEWKVAGVSLRNFVVEATFKNPYSANEHKWDIDIFFRLANNKNYRVDVSSAGSWSYGVELPDWKSLKKDTSFEKSNFDFKTEKGEANSLRIIDYEATGCFYQNNKVVGELDLSDLNQVGDVAVVIGSYSNSEVKDAVTHYENFSIYRINDFNGCP